MKYMRRLWCWLRSAKAKLHGVHWDGHCWGAHPHGVICLDCGKVEHNSD